MLHLPNPTRTIHTTLNMYSAGTLHSFIATHVQEGTTDLVGQIYAVRDAKSRLITYDLGQAEQIHQVIINLEGAFSGEAATAMQEADVALQGYMKQLMDHLSQTIATDNQFAEDIAYDLSRMVNSSLTSEVPSQFFAIGAFFVGVAVMQLGLDAVWDAFALLAILVLVVVAAIYVAIHPSPTAQAITDIQSKVQDWSAKTASGQDAGDISTPPPMGGEPTPPKPNDFLKWAAGITAALLVASATTYEILNSGQGPKVPDPSSIHKRATDLARKYKDDGCSTSFVEGLMDELAAQWKQDHRQDKKPLSIDDLEAQADTIMQGLRLRSQIDNLIEQINQSNLPSAVKQRLIDRINEELTGVDDNDYLHWNSGTLRDLNGILNGQWAEFQVAKQSDDASLKVRDCRRADVDYDIDALQGNAWVEVKNSLIYGPGNDSFDKVLKQLTNDYRVIANCPQNLPRPINKIILDVPKGNYPGLQQDLIKGLEDQGIDDPQLQVNQVDYGDPPAPQTDWCQ